MGLTVTKGWGLGAGHRLCQEHSIFTARGGRMSAGALRAGLWADTVHGGSRVEVQAADTDSA